MRIGPYSLDPPVVLAPMAGVTDKPFRQLCKRLGAGLAVSEMTTADPRLWTTRKSLKRMDHAGEPAPVSVQIAGYDPAMLAEAARYNVDLGAEIIDINMGCPAKKVCNVWSGSALLQDEPLVARILEAVVRAVDVPVTLKIRTGWNRENRNGLSIARIAENAGIAAAPVAAIDSTGAGDAFSGTLAAALLRFEDRPFRDAVAHANRLHERVGVRAAASIAHGDVHAVLGEELGGRGADAARSAGDEEHASRHGRVPTRHTGARRSHS